MKVTCKDFPRNVNGYIVDYDTNITINKSYIVLSYYDNDNNKINLKEDDIISLKELKMLSIMGNFGKCYYWSDYFYNEKELRKQKIKKLYNVNKE